MAGICFLWAGNLRVHETLHWPRKMKHLLGDSQNCCHLHAQRRCQEAMEYQGREMIPSPNVCSRVHRNKKSWGKQGKQICCVHVNLFELGFHLQGQSSPERNVILLANVGNGNDCDEGTREFHGRHRSTLVSLCRVCKDGFFLVSRSWKNTSRQIFDRCQIWRSSIRRSLPQVRPLGLVCESIPMQIMFFSHLASALQNIHPKVVSLLVTIRFPVRYLQQDSLPSWQTSSQNHHHSKGHLCCIWEGKPFPPTDLILILPAGLIIRQKVCQKNGCCWGTGASKKARAAEGNHRRRVRRKKNKLKCSKYAGYIFGQTNERPVIPWLIKSVHQASKTRTDTQPNSG